MTHTAQLIHVRAYAENNEWPPIDVLGLDHLQRGGCSTLISRYNATSTPWDCVAKVLSATFSNNQSKISRSTVTFKRSLFCGLRDIEYKVIAYKVINMHHMFLHSVAFNAIGGLKHGVQRQISARAEKRTERSRARLSDSADSVRTDGIHHGTSVRCVSRILGRNGKTERCGAVIPHEKRRDEGHGHRDNNAGDTGRNEGFDRRYDRKTLSGHKDGHRTIHRTVTE